MCQNADECINGWIECWSPGGPCERPNDPSCEVCGRCLDPVHEMDSPASTVREMA